MESYKNTPEWKALNHIWKACSSDTRAQCELDFRVLSEFIKVKQANQAKGKIAKVPSKKAPTSATKYLSPLSDKCQEFVLNNSPNLYHSIMAILDNYNFASCEEMLIFYMGKYSTARPYLVKNKKLVEEVAALCWKRYYEEGHYYD